MIFLPLLTLSLISQKTIGFRQFYCVKGYNLRMKLSKRNFFIYAVNKRCSMFLIVFNFLKIKNLMYRQTRT